MPSSLLCNQKVVTVVTFFSFIFNLFQCHNVSVTLNLIIFWTLFIRFGSIQIVVPIGNSNEYKSCSSAILLGDIFLVMREVSFCLYLIKIKPGSLSRYNICSLQWTRVILMACVIKGPVYKEPDQTDTIEAYTSTSRHLDGLHNIHNP